ncbi:MAG: glycosyltransferase family 4 protein, partial [Candidatus Nanopelagicales bacterium]
GLARPFWGLVRCLRETVLVALRVFIEPPDAIILRPVSFDFTALILGLWKPSLLILEVNAPVYLEMKRSGSPLWAVQKAMELATWRLASGITCVSQQLDEIITAETANAAPKVVVPNGVDPKRFCRASPKESDGKVTIGFSGSLKPWHGVDVLIRAIQRLPRSHELLIAGDGPERPSLSELALALGVDDRVKFAGRVAFDDIPSVLAYCDILVMPYKNEQPFYFSPLKMFEYMALAKPIVATGVGQIKDILGGAKAALLVEEATPELIADAVMQLTNDPASAASLAEKAHELSFRFTWDENARHVLEFADTLQQSRGFWAC